MRKTTLIFAVVVIMNLFTFGLFAAETKEKEFKKTYFGVLGGLNFGTFIGDDADATSFWGGGEKKSRTGIVVGGFAHFGIGDMFAIEPQVLYSQKGAKYTQGGSELTLKMDYIEVPVFARVYIPPIKAVKVSVLAGGYFGLNISNKYKYEEPGYEEEGDLENTNNIDGGLLFGAGVAFPFSKSILRFDLIYSLGLAKTFNLTPEVDIQNGAFSILASVGF
jgi:hypothetical protein